MENIAPNKIESEIAELSDLIEKKKALLENQSGGNVEHRAAISEVVKEHLGVPQPAPVQPAANVVSPVPPMTTQTSTPTSYLDNLSPEDSTAVNGYISAIPDKGFKQTVENVKVQTPYLLDLFHDALVTKLYDELKARGYIK